MSPLLERTCTRRGKLRPEFASVQANGLRIITALECSDEERAIRLQIDRKTQITRTCRYDLVTGPLPQIPYRLPEIVPGLFWFHVRPQEVCQDFSARGLARRAMEVRDERQRLAGSQDPFAGLPGPPLEFRRAQRGEREGRDFVAAWYMTLI